MAKGDLPRILDEARTLGRMGRALDAKLIEQVMVAVTESCHHQDKTDPKHILQAKLAARAKVTAAHQRGVEEGPRIEARLINGRKVLELTLEKGNG